MFVCLPEDFLFSANQLGRCVEWGRAEGEKKSGMDLSQVHPAEIKCYKSGYKKLVMIEKLRPKNEQPYRIRERVFLFDWRVRF